MAKKFGEISSNGVSLYLQHSQHQSQVPVSSHIVVEMTAHPSSLFLISLPTFLSSNFSDYHPSSVMYLFNSHLRGVSEITIRIYTSCVFLVTWVSSSPRQCCTQINYQNQVDAFKCKARGGNLPFCDVSLASSGRLLNLFVSSCGCDSTITISLDIVFVLHFDDVIFRRIVCALHKLMRHVAWRSP